ncbi:MAG: hypothetical protein LQ346_008327 [Caloplaca aetnensis]|nr:MAG: hypothetical protein LQ346_008327 [Caloplaca aetnensis]
MTFKPAKWIVLIAVDFYVDIDYRLKGCVNDADDFESWLKQSQDHVSVTKFLAVNTGDPDQTTPTGPADLWPTRGNVSRRLQEITEKAKAGDFVHVHYSGHGALKPTTAVEYRDFHESNGSDSALVLFDSKEEVSYLRGIEMASLFDDMVRKQLKLTVALDCCHAGSITRRTRLAYTHVRGIPWNPRVAAASSVVRSTETSPEESAQQVTRDGEASRHWLLRPDGYTLIAACGPNEIAGECRGEDGKIHGAFSYFLLGILASAHCENFTPTYGSIHQQLRAKLHARFPLQHPMLLGNPSITFLGAQAVDRAIHTAFSVVVASGIDQIWLNAGHAHGACLGDIFVIHPIDLPTDEVMKSHTNMNKVRTTAIHPLKSQAMLIQSPPSGTSIRAGWFATLISGPRLTAQIALFEDAGEDWIETINGSMWLQVIDQKQATLTAPTLHVRLADRDVINILDGSGQDLHSLPPISLHDMQAVHKVVTTLEHLAKFSIIERLENRSDKSLEEGACSVELRSENTVKPGLGDNRADIEEGATLVATFRNNTDVPLNISVLNLRPLREIKRVYPSRDRGDWKSVAPKGIQHGIKSPGEISFKIKMSFPEKIKATGCSTIEDIFKFFVTTRPSSFDGLELPELSSQILEPRRASSISNTLADLLNSLTVGCQPSHTVRGGLTGPDERWNSRNFIVNTRMKAVANSEGGGAAA